MKAIILAGGIGSRISEETSSRPKPMVEIGGKPILWHIMKIYSAYGINDFVICVGYRGYLIKEYFANYFLHMSDVTFDMEHNSIEVHQRHADPWRVTVVDTGSDSMTGGRLLRVQRYVENETFCFTYGDGVADINIERLIAHHRSTKSAATVTAVQPPGRFGLLSVDGDRVNGFVEKPLGEGGWVSGGFFVLEPSVFSLLKGDETVWEREPMETLASRGELSCFRHTGFWYPMDTLRDKNHLEELWSSQAAPWKVWK